MAKYLDNAGLNKLIQLIQAKDTELNTAIQGVKTTADKAAGDITTINQQITTINEKLDAITNISVEEVQTAWESGGEG